jgi:purine-nucleoside phosphorylase
LSSSPFDAIKKAADHVAKHLGRAPVGVVLGSGLSECLDNLDHPQFLDFSDIPGMPKTGVAGHRGSLLRGRAGDVDVLALCGRIHLYEGRPRHEIAMPVRVLSMLGVHTLVVTSAVGSVDDELAPGEMMLVEDHINLSGENVLAGDHDPRLGPRWPDLTDAYDRELSGLLEDTARMVGIEVKRGVLAHSMGPSFETPAEVRMAKTLGARVVSMSMVPEVLVARQRGMRVVGLGCVTNMAAGMGYAPLSHTRALRTPSTPSTDARAGVGTPPLGGP